MARPASGYAPISDYALIGNLRTCALVSTAGSIDWACFPRFDSPSAFAAILDERQGGRFRIAPAGACRVTRRYLPDTAVLETTFETETGTIELTDFMPVRGVEAFGAAAFPEILRRVRCTKGSVAVVAQFEPRFDYAGATTRLRPRKGGVLATDGVDEVLALACAATFVIDTGTASARAEFVLREGETRWCALRYDDDEVRDGEHYACEERLEETTRFWQEWTRTLTYTGPARDVVIRSAITLKLLAHYESGGVIAAATTSLPEALGAGRNWDYRYVWLRDAAFTIRALHSLGQKDEAKRFMRWLKRAARKSDSDLQIMYGVGGETWLEERELAHLDGYAASRPVRIGNGAYTQTQLDVYGEVLEAAYLWYAERRPSEGTWELLTRLADWVAANWGRKDHGIWEHRTEPEAYVFSRVMCWTALDRAIRLADRHELPAPGRQLWAGERDRIRDEVLRHGYSERVQSFTQHYRTDATDAANLLIGWAGFVGADDPRMLGTIAAVQRELVDPATGLVHRYRNDDGLEGEEGTFPICTLWLADALIRAGRRDEGRALFESVVARLNDVGLMSEEIAADGTFLGNFPQAYTHIALINTALLLEEEAAARRAGGEDAVPAPAA